jgi:hypothetical protein
MMFVKPVEPYRLYTVHYTFNGLRKYIKVNAYSIDSAKHEAERLLVKEAYINNVTLEVK